MTADTRLDPNADRPNEALPPLDLAAWLNAVRGGVRAVPVPSSIAPRQVDTRRDDRARRAAAYLSKIAPATAGERGHDRTFHAACVLVKGFDLGIDQAKPLLEAWNAGCIPPWSSRELEHKLRSASKSPDTKPRGYLLEIPDERRASAPDALGAGLPTPPKPSTEGLPTALGAGLPTPPKPSTEGLPSRTTTPDNDRTPHALASRFLANRFTHPGGLGLRYWRDEFHVWDGSAYRAIPHSELRAEISRFVAEEFAAIHREALLNHSHKSPTSPERLPRPIPVTGHLVADVVQAIASLVVLPAVSIPYQPAWIDGYPRTLTDTGSIDATGESRAPWPLNEILPARNALVHLPSFVASPDYPLADRSKAPESSEEPWSMPPTPRFFHGSALDYDFDPSAPPPMAWLEFLDRIWGDDIGSITCLQEWFGYLLHGDTRQQKILMMVGPKRSGRGTIARVLKALAGSSNVVNPTLTTLSRPFGLSSLIGKPIAVFPDARLSGRPDNAAIVECLLSISGEDDQTIDRKHLPAWTGRLSTRFVLISNELPKLRDASGALSSRLIILRFVNSFFGNEDTTLIDRLLAELPGILLWSIQGWDRLRKRGRFVQPRSAMELVATMDDLASPIAAFLRDRCVLEPAGTVPVAELYRAWREWCGHHGKEITGDEHSFGRALHAAIPSLTKTRPRTENGGRVFLYKGVRLRSLMDPDDEDEPAF